MAAEGSIDKLSIEVSSTAASAVRDIRDLSEALVGLKGSVGKTADKLASVASGIASIKTAASGLQVGNLRQLNEIKLNSSVGKQIKTLASAISLLPSDMQSRVAPIASLRALDGVKLSSTVGTNLAKVATALAFMPTDTAARLSGLSALRTLNGVKISSSVPNNLAKLAQAVAAFPAGAGSRLSGLANALLPLKELNGLRITTAINSLRQLPAVLKLYETLNIKNLIAQLDQLNPRLKSLASSASALKLAFNKMPSSLRTVASATRTVVSANRQLDSSQKSLSAGTQTLLGRLGSLASKFMSLSAAAYAARRVFNATIGEVNTYIENMNLFEASMGAFTESATEFGNTVQDLMGIDFGAWARNQGVFMTLITGMGETADRAAVMSQQLTQLGYDISSFYNISVEDAMLKLQSGMAGELEPLRRLGWDLSNARMQLEATRLGIDANVQSMTQAEKVGLRYYLIMNQVTQVHGDMARTIASPANQLRVLQAQVTLAARAVGNLFIPALNAILPTVIGVMKAIRMLAQTIASVFGIDASFEVDYSTLDTSGIASGVDTSGVDDLADSLDSAGSAAEGANKKVKELKNSVLGFDELNKLVDNPEESSSGSGGGGGGAGAGGVGGAGFDVPLDTYDFLAGLDDYITKLSDGIATKLVDSLKKIAPVVAGIGAGIAAWSIGKSLLKNAEKLATLFNGASAGAAKLANNLVKAGNATVGGKLGNGISKISLALGGIGGTFGAMSANAVKFLPILGSIAAVVTVAVMRFTDLYINSEKFRRGVGVILDIVSKIPDIVSGIVEAVSHLPKLVSNIWEVVKAVVKSLTGIDLSFLDGIVKSLTTLADLISNVVSPVVEALDLDFADVGLTAAGLAMVISGIGAPIGVALLAIEAVSLAIRELGWMTSPCIEKMDVLGEVSEETAKRFGTSIDSMEGAISDIDRIVFSDAIVTEDDVQSITAKTEDIRDTLLNNLDAKRNQELADIEALKGFLTDEEIEAARKRVEETYDKAEAEVNSGTDEIHSILESAYASESGLSQEQSDRINQILSTQYDLMIETSGASSAEIAKIEEARRNNQTALAAETASNVIKEALRTTEESKAQAQANYDNQVKVARQLYDANEISKERYDELVALAKDERDRTVENADLKYQEIVEKTKLGLGDQKDAIDYGTGEIKAVWQQFIDGIVSKFEWLRDRITECVAGVVEAIIEKIAWLGSWYESTVKPAIENVKKYIGWAGEAVGRFLSDPVGWIKNAWDRIGTWFYNNVYVAVWNNVIGVRNAIWNPFCEAWNKVLDLWVRVGNWFYDNIYTPIRNVFGWVYDAIVRPFRDARDAILNIFGHLHIRTKTWTTPFGLTLTFPTGIAFYKEGGFPTPGQLFYAREDGSPELVGSMGGKSAVANNEQIVEGIEAGVMSAMLQVLPAIQNDRSSGDVTLVLRVGSEELARATSKGNASLARRGQLKTELQFA